jgi:zeaxanthin glucosyltransferase
MAAVHVYRNKELIENTAASVREVGSGVAYAVAFKFRQPVAITHAGLNTALESLSQGVPMVAIPITNDQPGVASRLEWLGWRKSWHRRGFPCRGLARRIEHVLHEPAYREKARRYQQEIVHLNGLARAADIVDQAISLHKPVLRGRS